MQNAVSCFCKRVDEVCMLILTQHNVEKQQRHNQIAVFAVWGCFMSSV